MGKKDDNVLPAHGPKHEGVDPLTEGKTTYGEDVKGASTFHDAPADVDAASEDQGAQADMVQAQEERAADPASAKEGE